jgi:BirA family biotin operon repressor/biotin-[acetyl-CoA-carboxylase] ligase
VVDAIAELRADLGLSLKWPNDVLLGGRKVAGILCEAQLQDGEGGWIVVGIGINVSTAAFPDELAGRATSLRLAGAGVLDRSNLFVALATGLGSRIEALRAGGGAAIIGEVAARDALAGRAVTVDGVAATALGIAPSGGLRLKRRDGSETICMAGDVQLSRPGE